MKKITFMTEEDLKTMKHGTKLRLATLEELNDVSQYLENDDCLYQDDPGIIGEMEGNFGKEITFKRKRFNNSFWFKIVEDTCWYDIRWCIKESESKYRWKR